MSHFAKVFWREVGRIVTHPAVWGAVLLIPLFCALLTATVFGSGEMEELPIGVIDMDTSPTSRTIIRMLNTSPTLDITTYPTSQQEALEMIRRGEIYGYVVLPRGLTRALIEGRSATIPYYYHYALMGVGGEVATTLRTALTMVSVEPIVEGAIARGTTPRQIRSVVEPIEVEIHPLGNPTLNYNTYLSAPFFFIMYQIIIMLSTLYVVGCEREEGSAREWIACAGGDVVVALAGKLAPYSLCFLLTGIGAVAVLQLFGALTLGVWHTIGAMVLLVGASMALALFIYGLVPVMGVAMSLVSMVGSLGATLSGVTFPTEAMYPLFDHLARLLPVRHFTLLIQSEGFMYNWQHIVVLLLFLLLPLLTMGRLRRSLTKAER